VEVFQCLPDELSARLDALGPDRGHRALIELLGYYEVKEEDRKYREWEAAVTKANALKQAQE
jgi:hypothetical protein